MTSLCLQAQVVFDLATKTLNWRNVDVLVSADAAYSKSLMEKVLSITIEIPSVYRLN